MDSEDQIEIIVVLAASVAPPKVPSERIWIFDVDAVRRRHDALRLRAAAEDETRRAAVQPYVSETYAVPAQTIADCSDEIERANSQRWHLVAEPCRDRNRRLDHVPQTLQLFVIEHSRTLAGAFSSDRIAGLCIAFADAVATGSRATRRASHLPGDVGELFRCFVTRLAAADVHCDQKAIRKQYQHGGSTSDVKQLFRSRLSL